MNAKCEEQIACLRRMGESYGKIAEQLGISANTVKSFCQRSGLGGRASAETWRLVMPCAHCGCDVLQTEHRKPKRFCSDTCRTKWWNAHQYLIERKTVVVFRCQHCGKEFTDYKSTERKYCSHECYITDRFGNTDNERGAVPQ